MDKLTVSTFPTHHPLHAETATEQGSMSPATDTALSDILSRVHRSPVDTTRRRGPGLYRVTLANGAEAKVSRDNAVSGDTGTGKWQWDDDAGGVPDHKTKAAAVRSFREYRG